MLTLAITVSIIFIGWIAYGYFSVNGIEQLSYKVLEAKNGYEIREIEKHILAETSMSGSFQEGGNSAFSVIAGYIFGANKQQEKIAMTTPVIRDQSEKIAMTTPVIFDEESEGKMAFVLPSKYTLETLPVPLDSRVEIREVEPYKVAALIFNGIGSDSNYKKHKALLADKLKRDGIEYSKIISAGYNPPGTPPFMNRLEVWAVLNQ